MRRIKRRRTPTHQLAVEAIQKGGGTAPISVVIDYILEREQFGGKTPRKTVNATLHRSPAIQIADGICSLRRADNA